MQRHRLALTAGYGVAYLLIGLVFGELARRAGSIQTRNRWRAAAYLVSAIVFAINIGYESHTRRNTSRSTAFSAAWGVAVGAFLLAAAANVHTLFVGEPYRPRLAISLLAWPLLTAIPAFLVALLAAIVLERIRPNAQT